ncbi:DMT family transporter [Ruegeria meonggei]|uniref:Putative DMT superfamily transporter inner membrane protein n=1 Tax=Ruegeria meonggei TaxID=1446476 RepID=A0A1X6YZ71_9RHOB|nr:DMT family transporter [Ruegeria meonggei]SLN35644.1 putative DMT superfamily transporter inner membrane protein [Ruegeria meonggei]
MSFADRPPHKAAANWQVQGLMLIATFLVATSFPVVAAITDSVDSSVLTFLRFALATVLFAPLVAWRYGLGRPGLYDLMRYGVLSFLLVTFFWCMFASLRLTSPLNTAAIFSLSPVITAGIAAVLLRDRIGLSARIALPIGAAGAIWVVFRGDLAAMMAVRIGASDLLFFGGTIAFAVYSTLVKVLHRGEPLARMTFWILATGTVWLFLLSVPDLSRVAWTEIPATTFAGIAYLSAFTTIVTFFLFQWGTTQIGPTRVTSYTFLNPVLVLFIGLAFGDALPPVAIWPGIGLAISATIVLQLNGVHKGLKEKPISGAPAPQGRA